MHKPEAVEEDKDRKAQSSQTRLSLSLSLSLSLCPTPVHKSNSNLKRLGFFFVLSWIWASSLLYRPYFSFFLGGGEGIQAQFLKI